MTILNDWQGPRGPSATMGHRANTQVQIQAPLPGLLCKFKHLFLFSFLIQIL